ncbi:MAG: peptidoglycan recognition family protein [Lachnospiraceae bacterium]|nr:peptidoglycan recognition family protein [Lachnospiraceae bacterium]
MAGKKRRMLLVLLIDVLLAIAILITGGMLVVRWYRDRNRPELSKLVAPDWYTQEFLVRNPYSRPGIKRTQINDIVVHYVANPGTSAEMNRSYFNNLAGQTGNNATSASSHYIIGLDGEILQCIPLDEVAYANYPRNDDTVSIECCHPDESGEFTEETAASLVRLTAWLCQELNLNERDVIRHYDVIGKNCPKYYVEHEDAWKALKKKMKTAIREGKES